MSTVEETEPDKETEISCGGRGSRGEGGSGAASRRGRGGPADGPARVRAKAPRRGCLRGLRKAGVSGAGGGGGARGR